MARLGKSMISMGLETLYFTGGHHLARPFLGGIGSILTFHRVRPALPDAFQPNRSLEITPEFLDETIGRLRRAGLDIVSMDEACLRLGQGDDARRFVVLTFDDAYRDFAEHAWPVLERHGAPATLYVPSSFADGRGVLWWIELERAIAAQTSIELAMDAEFLRMQVARAIADREPLNVAMAGERRRFDTATPAGKQEAFATIYWWLRTLADEADIRRVCRELALEAGIDVGSICAELCMGWDEIAALAGSPLITIGAHTDNHIMLAKASEASAREEMRSGARRLREKLGVAAEHLSYPVGDPTSAGLREFRLAAELGFRTGVTTRPGVLFPEHGGHLTALPRLSVNGDFQRFRYLDVLMSGAPSYVLNRFRRVAAA